MNWFRTLFIKKGTSANIAKERLQLILSHEHAQANAPDYLPQLQREIMDVIAKYVKIDRNQVHVDFDKKNGCSILELNVTLPESKQPQSKRRDRQDRSKVKAKKDKATV